MNAVYKMTIDSTGEYVFKSGRVGGYDLNGAKAITLYNSGSVDASILCSNLHDTVAKKPDGTSAAGLTQRGPLPAGASVTLRAPWTDSIHVKADSSTTTISLMVTERG
jgi:hypothetical protein